MAETANPDGFWTTQRTEVKNHDFEHNLALAIGINAYSKGIPSLTTAVNDARQVACTWLGIIYNTYWDHLVYSNDTSTVHKDLDDATSGAIERIKELIDNHAERSKNRTRLVPQQTALPDAQNTGSPDGGK